jgi:plastocyanin
MRVRIVLASLVVVLSLVAAMPARAATHIVHVVNSEFNPDPTIRVGDTVTWLFEEDMGHTTTSVRNIPEQWDSGPRSSEDSYSHTFTRVGTWHYYCQPHGFDSGNGTAGGMAGIIRVVPEPASAGLLGAAAAVALLRRHRRRGASPASSAPT